MARKKAKKTKGGKRKLPKEVRIEYEALSKVKRWPKNPKQHDLDSLGESIDRFGFVQPLLKDERSGKLVAGHGRMEKLESMKKAGLKPPRMIQVKGKEWMVPVIRGISFKNEQEAQAYVVADNRTVELGGWDEMTLAEILQELSEDSGLEGVGYNESDLEALVALTALSGEDEVPDLDGYEEPERKFRVIIACDSMDEIHKIQEHFELDKDTRKTTYLFSDLNIDG